MYNFRLTEEISRWAFEVVCKNNSDWYIAFTNPTAGPWKTIKCTNAYGQEGEVYRFELEETRPDILLVNDKLKVVMIIEAKDSLAKLISGDQAPKSVEVVATLSEILRKKKNNSFWSHRSNYTIVVGLLWGAEHPSTQYERQEVFNRYFDEMESYKSFETNVIVGIETCRHNDGLICKTCYQTKKNGATTINVAPIVKSFNLNSIK